MDLATLTRVKDIATAINEYGNKHTGMDYDTLMKYVKIKAKASLEEIETTIQFLQDIQGGAESLKITSPDGATIVERVKAFTAKPINLAEELQYNYGVARALLEIILERSLSPEGEELRKTLREISRFSDAMLKMQERVFNLQTMQAFQEKVLQVLEDLSPDTKEIMVNYLLESDL